MQTWPASLPAPLVGSSYSPVDPQISTPMQDGRTFVRRNFTAVPVGFTASWLMTDAQAVEFERFYKEDLGDGVEYFLMRLLLPQGHNEYAVRFSGIYTGPSLASPPNVETQLWRYSASLQMYLRP